MTTTPLPQVAGFDAPIAGGFWAPTDKILEQTSLGCQPGDPGLFSLKLREVLRELQLTFNQWVILAGRFDKLFSHVAGKLATMDAFRSKRSKHRACVRSVARVLLRARRVS